MSAPVLELRELCIAFRREQGLEPVVDGVSFDIQPGETVALVGESGSGKSVTAMALMGLLPASQAETHVRSLRLDGKELPKQGARAWRAVRGSALAMIFQEAATALDPVFTIRRQLVRTLQRRDGIGASEAARRAANALERVGFQQPTDVLRSYPHQLSGGMRQLVMIAMAMAVRPRLLIADEPTTALDVTTQAWVIDKLEALQHEHGTAILLVTHDLGVAARCSDRALVMYCGRLVEQAAYPELFHRPRHPYTRGLLDAVPRLTAVPPLPVRGIPGRVPALSERLSGCHFAPRCPYADGKCHDRFPPTEQQGASRVACFHPLGANR